MRLNRIDDVADGVEYPITTEAFVRAHGDRVIELPSGEETLGEVLSRLADETYERPAEVREAVRSAVSHKAVGRRFYSDRDAPAVGEVGPTPVSF